MKYLIVLVALLALSAPLSAVRAEETPPGLQYSCLKTEWCINSQNCSSNHVHRVKLSTDKDTSAAPSSQESYITECIEIVDPTSNTPKTVCTTGSSDLDKELFCGSSNPDPSSCDFFQKLQTEIGYSQSPSEDYGIYFLNAATNLLEKKGPTKVITDALGNMNPAVVEWQSYTPQNHERRFLLWSHVTEDTAPTQGQSSGQKQGTLTFPSLSTICQGVSWDPEGIVYDMETGIPLNTTQLQIDYSTQVSGPFQKATSGIGEILPPGTENPMQTTVGGFYRFYGSEGYYTIKPTHSVYGHFVKDTLPIATLISSMYAPSLNYYANSAPIFEKAGVRKIQNIPMVLKPGQTRPPFTFQVLSNIAQVNAKGEMVMTGKVNAPATVILEICSNLSGITNCHDRKEYVPGSGGASPSNNFTYALTASQKDLKNGENYIITFKQVNPLLAQSLPRRIAQNILNLISSIISVVHAEEPNGIQLLIEPVPTYLEGYAYDRSGISIPNALISIYVSFSPPPLYQTYANAQGYFRITSEHLPRDPYTIKFKGQSDIEVTLSTSQFLAQNNEFFVTENVNPYSDVTESNNPRAKITPSFLPRVGESSMSITKKPQKDISPTVIQEQQKPPQQSLAVYMAMLVFLIIVVIVAVILYIKKRKSDSHDISP